MSELKSPYPWFGGKSTVATDVWKRFGQVRNYVDPFFGSGAMLLQRPEPFDGVETINDLDGFVANLWRAIQDDPGLLPVMRTGPSMRRIWKPGTTG